MFVNSTALAKRINRKLRRNWVQLHKTNRRSRHYCGLGDWFLTDMSTSVIIEKDVDLLALAKELGVISASAHYEETAA